MLTSVNQVARIFKRFKGIVLLNMAGLALGLAGVLFISIWIGHQMSYDRFHEDHERIYRVEALLDWGDDPFVWTVAPGQLAADITKDYPEVESAVRMRSGYRPVIKNEGQLMEAEELYFVSPEFLDMFSFELLQGNRDRVLNEPYSVVLTEGEAMKLFGRVDVLGETLVLKVLQLKGENVFTVTGVMTDPPSNSHLRPSYLLPYFMLSEKSQGHNNWRMYNFPTYIKLKEGVDAGPFNQKLASYLQTKDEKADGRMFLNPLDRLYLYRDPGFKDLAYPSAYKGPIGRVILFGVIGFALLLLACINFINLSTACGSSRAKEIGVRKVSGAGRNQLVTALFSESFIQTIASAVFSVIIVIALMPVFNRITDLQAGFNYLFSLRNIIIIVVVTLLAGILAGLYPALVLSSFSPVKVLRSNKSDNTQGEGLRKVLVVTQLVMSIVFIFSIMVMNRQIKFMQNSELGFDKEQVMVINPRLGFGHIDALAAELAGIAGVKKVALGGNVPVNMGNWQVLKKWDGNTAGKSFKFHLMQVDDNYIDLLGINIGQGRQLMEGRARDEVILNEAAVRMMGMNDPLGKKISRNNVDYEIVGITDDFYFRKLTEEVAPVFIFKDDTWAYARLFLKLEPGAGFALVDRISSVIKESDPTVPPDFYFLDDKVDRYYEQERRMNKLINTATILSIFISAIGLFSLTAYATRKRYKEIGVRKVHGAPVSGLLLMLQRQLGVLILVASVIALPLAYYIINRWLENYACHIEVGVGFFVFTLLSVIIIASLTVSYHTFRTTRLNPVDVLKDE